MSDMHRRAVLRSALGLPTLESHEREFNSYTRRFDNWRGIGDIVADMARQEYDLEHSQSRRSGISGISRASLKPQTSNAGHGL